MGGVGWWWWWIVVVVTVGVVGGAEDNVRDCAIVRLDGGYQVAPVKHFNDTLQVGVFPMGAAWEAVAMISDTHGNTCVFKLENDANNATLKRANIKCRDNYTSPVAVPVATPLEWTHLLLSATDGRDYVEEEGEAEDMNEVEEEEPGYDLMAVVRGKDGAKTFLEVNPSYLVPPLRLKWYTHSNLSLVFNCYKGTGCELHKTALQHGRGRDSFFFHRGSEVPRVTVGVTVAPGSNLNITLGPELPQDPGWKVIRILQDRFDLKVLVDGIEVRRVRTDNIFPDNDITHVQLDGGGQLTWCDPRVVREVTEKPKGMFVISSEWHRDWLPWLVVAVVGAMFIVVTICLIRYRRKYSESRMTIKFLRSRSDSNTPSFFMTPPQDLPLITTRSPTTTPDQTPTESFAPSSMNSTRASQLSFDNPAVHWPHLANA